MPIKTGNPNIPPSKIFIPQNIIPQIDANMRKRNIQIVNVLV